MSVIIPTFNREKFIAKAFDTVLGYSSRERIAGLQDNLQFFRSTWVKRAALIASRMLSRMPLRTIARKIGIFLVPGPYRLFDAIRESRRIWRTARASAAR